MTKIIGILNITPDSFSDGGKFNSSKSAINHLKEMLNDGVDMIDIGAESTRPGAIKITDEEEWRRLELILPEIIAEVRKFNQETGKKIQTSIDSYHFSTIKKAYEIGIDIINDVSGLIDEEVINFIAERNIATVLMHNTPILINPELIINPYVNDNVEIINWAKSKIDHLLKKGVKKSQLIFDPGIGFAKNSEQSIRILKNIDDYQVLELPIYIGHSKKSFLDKVGCFDSEGENLSRAEKTLIISKYLIKKKIDFIRIHDVKEHVLAISCN